MLFATLCLACAPVLAPQGAGFDRDNVVICLDASGSMEHPLPGARLSKMEAAKDAIRTVLSNVPETTQVGLLVFSGQGKQSDWVYPLGERNDRALVEAMTPIQAAGKTPLGRYMKQAADALLTQRAAQNGYGTFRMLVVTDGQASDQDELDGYLPDMLRRGILLDVIGVAMDEDHDLARKVHSYRRADDDAGLRTAISEVFAEVQTSSGQDLAADFELLDALPSDAVQGIIDRVASRDDEPIGRMRRSSADSEVTLFGESRSSRPSFGSFAGILGLVCFGGFVVGTIVLFKLIRVLKK